MRTSVAFSLAAVSLAAICLGAGAQAVRAETFEDKVAKFLETYGKADMARYMEPANGCVSFAVAGWSGFPTIKCTYAGDGKTTLVVAMLNPARERLARWIVSGCKAAGLSAKPKCWAKLWEHIIGQSGAQFPVSGLVDESFSGNCEKVCFIAFRDGVAVKLKALDEFPKDYRNSKRSLKKFDVTDAKQVAWALSEPFDEPGDLARIASTTIKNIEDWVKAHPEDAAPAEVAQVFPDLIAYYYKRAWTADRNVLIDAWALANASTLK